MSVPLSRPLVFVFLLALFAVPLHAASFDVDEDGSLPDLVLNGTCLTANGGCSLEAAIMEANSTPVADTITFSIPSVTLTDSLPQILFPITIDGGGSPRVILIGAPGINGIDLQAGAGSTTGAGSTIQNLEIRSMGGHGISITGYGNKVYNCYIGTDGATAFANNGDGIRITTPAVGPFADVTDIDPITGNAIGDAVDASKGNVISGNVGVGVYIFAERTVKNVVANNIIGLRADQSAAIPNGSHGIQIAGNAFANTIGPGNVVAGNTAALADGINVSGAVWKANVITGNHVGRNAAGADFGNANSGIRIETSKYVPSVTWTTEVGPDNQISWNDEHGIFVTSGATSVWVWGNFIGVADGGMLALANDTDGIRVTTAGNKIGGSGAGEGNVISANLACGIRLQSNSATDNIIQGNIIGRDSTNTINISNSIDGIYITTSAGNNTVGGQGAGEGNIIAGNGRHGIKIDNSAASNLISGNSIRENGVTDLAGIGIDLDQVSNGKDSTTNAVPGIDPNTLYSNWGQNAPVILNSGVDVPHYNPANGQFVVPWTLESAPSTQYDIEFFASQTPNSNATGEGWTFLGATSITTDASGNYANTSSLSPLAPTDTRGLYITMTATPKDTIDPPGPTASGPANNTSEFSNAVVTPNPGAVQFSSATYNVGESGLTVTITATRTGGSSGAISIDYTTSDGTADTLDYSTASGTLNWADGDTMPKTFDVTIAGDSVYEGNETVNLTLSNPGGYAELAFPSTAGLTITDDDVLPSMSIGDVTLAEGNAPTTTAFSFTVSLSGLSAFPASATVSSSDVSATTADIDYFGIAGLNVNIPAGSLTANVSVTVQGDNNVEPDETFSVGLSGITGASAGDITGTGTITNDDNPLPSFTIGDVSLNEGNAGTTPFTFTVNLNPAPASTVTVDVATANSTATTADGDYAAASQTLTFNSGETSKNFTVDVNGDTKYEPANAFLVNLSNPSAGTTITDASATGTIQNDDTQPTISIGDVSLLEGNSGGFVNWSVPVTLSHASEETISVNVATSNGTATTADGDYTSTSNTLIFNPGITFQTADVPVFGDTTDEGADETFTVTLSSPANASILDGTATVTIQNDDAPMTPTLSINSVSLAEGNAGTTLMSFTVSLSPAAAGPVTVQAATSNGTATTVDGDYAANTQTLTFAAGDTSETFTVTINGDTKFETGEAFNVTLSSPTGGAVIGASSGTGTINNDDAQPSISVGDVTQAETGGATTFTFIVSLSNASDETVSVNYATANDSAVEPGDYGVASGTLIFNPGVLTQQFNVTVNGDPDDEPNETFFVNLSSPANGSIGDGQGIGTIVNDDSSTPTFTIDNVTLSEGNAGTTAFTFTVTLSPVSGVATSVDASVANGTATTADNDFTGATQTLNFPAGTPTQTYTVNVNGDLKFELNETFTVNLANATGGAAIGLGSGTGTITNDDSQPTITIGDISQIEGDAGTVNWSLIVSLSNPSYQTITVDFATADDSAVAPADYSVAAGTLTFNPGVTAQTADIPVVGETSVEPNQTFFVNLTNAINASIADNQATVTIIDDDNPNSTFSIGDVTLNEGNAGTTAFTFTVTLAPALPNPSTVVATITDNSATTADSDYTAIAPVTLTFAAGDTTETVTVNVTGDTKLENTETFTVTLGTNTGTTVIGDGTATGTIVNDDAQPQMAIAGVSQFEGNSGTTAFQFLVTLTNPSAFPITVDYTTSNGTADGSDYATTSGTLTFPPGSTTQTITVLVLGDLENEPNETFFMTLSNAGGATITTAAAQATIQNDPTDTHLGVAHVPALGPIELAILAALLAAIALVVMRR